MMKVEKDKIKIILKEYFSMFHSIITDPKVVSKEVVLCMENVVKINDIKVWNVKEIQFINYNIEALLYLIEAEGKII